MDDVARLRALFNAGVNLDVQNEYGQTCSHVAAFFDHTASLLFLASHGADLQLAANDGSNVFTVVAARKHPGTLQVIESHLRRHHVISLNAFDTMVNKSKLNADLPISSFSPPPCKEISTALATTPSTTSGPKTTVLIPLDSPHDGAGSRIIDNAFHVSFLEKLDHIWKKMPVAPPEKASCNERGYFCDAEGWVMEEFRRVLSSSNMEINACSPTQAMPHIRFVNYPSTGGVLAPHIDLSRCHHIKHTLRSTFTFLLYLSDCNEGGETALLEHLPSIESSSPAIAAVKPKRGRLLLFPHVCPHEGCPVVDCPKLFLRGELY
jgi:E3 ubiquitin-protein ligase listerin